jgi:RHS repeat-associated protein
VFDRDGHVTKTIDALNLTSYSYFDSDGRLTESVDTAGHMTTTLYDGDGRVTETIDADSHFSYYSYDANGNLTQSKDALGTTTYRTYDEDGRLTGLTDPDGNHTAYAYDNAGNQTLMTDPNGNKSYTYYDQDGRVSSRIDRDGRKETYAYDNNGNLLTELWYNSSNTLVNTQNFTYDGDGRQLTASDANGTYTYTYDSDGRLTHVAEPFGLGVTYFYDGDGNRVLQYDNNSLTTSVYDANGNLTSRQYSQGTPPSGGGPTIRGGPIPIGFIGPALYGPGGGISIKPDAGSGGGGSPPYVALRFDQTWTADGQLGTVTRYPNTSGTGAIGTTSYTYDQAGNVTDIIEKAGTVTLEHFAYTYDQAGQLSTEVDNGGTPITYLYDADGQLTDVVSASSTAYSYDANGNRTGTGITTGTGNELTGDGTYTYTYDSEGNRLTKRSGTDITTYTYDNMNHLTGVIETVSGTVTARATYVYDVLGNRIEMDDFSGGTTSVIRSGYDGNHVDQDVSSTGAFLAHYLFADGEDTITARVTTSNLVPAWYLPDRQGSVRGMTDGSGVLQDQITYNAFGGIVSETHANFGDRFKYTGREWDGVTKLQYNRARYYDPSTGTWVSQDPMGFGAGDDNLYRYAGNGPTNGTDPSGQFDEELFWQNVEKLSPGLQKWFEGPEHGVLQQRGWRPWRFNVTSDYYDTSKGGLTTVYLADSYDEIEAAKVFVNYVTKDSYNIANDWIRKDIVDFPIETHANWAPWVTAKMADAGLAGAKAIGTFYSVFVKGVDWTITALDVLEGKIDYADIARIVTLLPLAKGSKIKVVDGKSGTTIRELDATTVGGAARLSLKRVAATGKEKLMESIDLINPFKAKKTWEGGANCGECALQTDYFIKTGKAIPANSSAFGMTCDELAGFFGKRRFVSMTQEEAANTMVAAGNNATGILYLNRAYKTDGEYFGHFVNVVNRNGKLEYYDGQAGTILRDSIDLLKEFGCNGIKLLRTSE